MARKCILCMRRPAEVPDRERMGRPIKRVCRQCHALRLTGDLRKVMELHDRKATEKDHGA